MKTTRDSAAPKNYKYFTLDQKNNYTKIFLVKRGEKPSWCIVQYPLWPAVMCTNHTDNLNKSMYRERDAEKN